MKLMFLSLLISIASFAQTKLLYHTEATLTLTSGVQVAPARVKRNYLIIQNHSNGSVWVKFASNFSSETGIEIPKGGNYEPFEAPTDSIWMKSDGSPHAVTILEGEKL